MVGSQQKGKIGPKFTMNTYKTNLKQNLAWKKNFGAHKMFKNKSNLI
jgi:hypothetical protein